MKIRYKCGYDEKGKWFCLPFEQYYAEQTAKLNIICDEIEPTLHPCNQRIYTSKSAFRAISRLHGKEEIGNEYEAFAKQVRPQIERKPYKKTIKEAIDIHELVERRPESEKREILERFIGE